MGNVNRGFRMPAENRVPEDNYCLTVYIPMNTDYLINFLTVLDNFGKWNSWLREGDNEEKLVADRWKVSNQLTHDAWAAGGCEHMTLRQNPDNPCQLEQSTDGETWTLAFDYSLCSSVITVPAPYPGSETGASDAAAASMRNIFEALTNMVDCEASRESYIAAATAYLRTFDAGYANPAALGAVYDAFCALDTEGQDLWKSDCPFDEHKTDIEACADANGLYDWLNCGAETINDWLNDTSEAIMDALNQAAAALSPNGWQNSAAGGAGGGGGFGSTCMKTKIWDFNLNDDYGWQAYDGYVADLVDGEGFATIDCYDGGGAPTTKVQIKYGDVSGHSRVIYRMKMYYQIIISGNAPEGSVRPFDGEPYVNGSGAVGEHTVEWTGTGDMNWLYAYVMSYYNGFAGGGGALGGYLHKIEVDYTGDDL